MPRNEESGKAFNLYDFLIKLLEGKDIEKSSDQENEIHSLIYNYIKDIQTDLSSNLDEKIKIYLSYSQYEVAIKKYLSTILNETFQVKPSPFDIIKTIKESLPTDKSIQEISGGVNTINIEDTLASACLNYDQLFQRIRQSIEKNLSILLINLFKKNTTSALFLRKDQSSNLRRIVEDLFFTLLQKIFDNDPANPLTSIEDHFWRGYHNRRSFKLIFGGESCEKEIFYIIRNFTENLDRGLRQFYSEINERFENFGNRLQDQSTAQLLVEKLKDYLSEFYLKLLQIVRLKNKIKTETTTRNKATNNSVFFTNAPIDEKNANFGNSSQNESAAETPCENVKNCVSKLYLPLLQISRSENNPTEEKAKKWEAADNFLSSIKIDLAEHKSLYPQDSKKIENFIEELTSVIRKKIPLIDKTGKAVREQCAVNGRSRQRAGTQ